MWSRPHLLKPWICSRIGKNRRNYFQFFGWKVTFLKDFWRESCKFKKYFRAWSSNWQIPGLFRNQKMWNVFKKSSRDFWRLFRVKNWFTFFCALRRRRFRGFWGEDFFRFREFVTCFFRTLPAFGKFNLPVHPVSLANSSLRLAASNSSTKSPPYWTLPFTHLFTCHLPTVALQETPT